MYNDKCGLDFRWHTLKTKPLRIFELKWLSIVELNKGSTIYKKNQIKVFVLFVLCARVH
jgi:hypothetical protein